MLSDPESYVAFKSAPSLISGRNEFLPTLVELPESWRKDATVVDLDLFTMDTQFILQFFQR